MNIVTYRFVDGDGKASPTCPDFQVDIDKIVGFTPGSGTFVASMIVQDLVENDPYLYQYPNYTLEIFSPVQYAGIFKVEVERKTVYTVRAEYMDQ